jgi:MoaA/NifB/PqqE/SkfB family radical SAM enzyme
MSLRFRIKSKKIKFIKNIILHIMKVFKNYLNPPAYAYIAADITGNCNLRCPFCINDFSVIKDNPIMTETTFEKILSMVPLISGCNFYISCHFEPSIHNRLLDFLEKIPSKYRKHIFFTTNLCNKISDQDIQRLSCINIHHINISIDTLNPTLFEQLRKSAKFEIFHHNLQRLVTAFSNAPNPPLIHYMTVALQPNLEGIPQLVETCAEKYLAYTHEVRHIYEVPHLGNQWKQEHLLSNSDWENLQEFAHKYPYSVSVVPPADNYFPSDDQPYSRKPENSPATDSPPASPPQPMGLVIRADGSVYPYGHPEAGYNINDVDDPVHFFKNKRDYFQSVASKENQMNAS